MENQIDKILLHKMLHALLTQLMHHGTVSYTT